MADGQVAALVMGESARLVVEWMAEEGAAPPWLLAVDWSTFAPSRLMGADPELLDLMRRSDSAIEAWLRTKTKSVLYEGAVKRRILLAPVSTVQDIFEDEQLAARGYWRTIFHPGVGKDLTVPGAVRQVQRRTGGNAPPGTEFGGAQPGGLRRPAGL